MPGWLLGVVGVAFLIQVAVYAARPAVSYRAVELGASGAGLGAIVAAFAVLSLVCAVPVGWLVDRCSERPFLAAGAVLVAALSYALTQVATLALLGVALALLGLGHLLIAIGMQTLIANRSGPGRAAAHFGMFTLVVSLGQLAGPALLGLLAGDAGRASGADTGAVFVAAGVAATLAAFLVPAVGGPGTAPRADDGEARPSLARAGLRVLRMPNMPQAMLVSLSVLAASDVLVAYLPVYGEATGLSVRTVGLLLATRSAAALVARAWMGAAVRWLGLGRLLAACTVTAAAALALFPLAHDVPVLLYVLMACAGLGLGLGQPLTLAWVAQTAPADIKATAIAVRLSGNRAGQVAIPAAVGGLVGLAGAGAIFWAMTLLLTTSAAALVGRRTSFGHPDEY